MAHPTVIDFTGEDVLRGLITMVARRDPAALTALLAVLRPAVYQAALDGLGDADLADQVTCATFLEVWHLSGDHLHDARGVRGWVMGVCGRRTGDLQRLRPHAIGYNSDICDRLTAVLHGEPTAVTQHPHRLGTAAGGTPL